MITNYSTDALGEYQVLILNAHGMALSQVALLSVEAPVIRSGPTNITRTVLAPNATFSVAATGAGKLTYQWYHNGILITNSIRIKGADTALLTIGNGIQNADEGDYGVVITNFANMTNSASATLTIFSPPPPTVTLSKAVKPSFSDLGLGTTYQLQVSSDMNTWTNHGSPFTGTNSNMIYPQYFDVDNWEELFFRLQVLP